MVYGMDLHSTETLHYNRRCSMAHMHTHARLPHVRAYISNLRRNCGIEERRRVTLLLALFPTKVYEG